MFVDSPDKSWEAYGRDDPYFGVAADPRYRAERLSDAAKAEFFASGEAYVSDVMDKLDAHVGRIGRGRALDFGSGVGRIALPLARRFGAVVGVDVSPSMIREAESNALRFGLPNASFLLSGGDDLPNVDGRFDLVNTVIVLQHIQPHRGYRIVGRLLDLVADGGACALHVNLTRRATRVRKAVNWTRARFLPLHHALNLASGRKWNEPLMQMNVYELNRIALMMQERGFDGFYAHRFHDEPHPGVIIMGIKGRPRG